MIPVIVCMAAATAEAGTVSGIVFDETDGPLAGVQVVAEGGTATTTDTDGAFSLELPEGEVTLRLTAPDRAPATLGPFEVPIPWWRPTSSTRSSWAWPRPWPGTSHRADGSSCPGLWHGSSILPPSCTESTDFGRSAEPSRGSGALYCWRKMGRRDPR